MKEILREYISQQIRSNCFNNIPLTTKRITPIIRPQSLKDEDVNEFIFFCGTESDIHYKCKFDENGKFLGWHKC